MPPIGFADLVHRINAFIQRIQRLLEQLSICHFSTLKK